MGKRLELLKETLPGLSRVAVLWDSFGQRQLDEVKRAAHTLHIKLEPVQLGAPYDFKAAFKTAKQRRAARAGWCTPARSTPSVLGSPSKRSRTACRQ